MGRLTDDLEHEKKIDKFIQKIEKLGCYELNSGTINADIVIRLDSRRFFGGKRYFVILEKK